MSKRIYHRVEDWECYRLGLYGGIQNLSKEVRDNALNLYAEFLKDSKRFSCAIERVFREWPISCEQFLLNDSINRIAWIGQSAMFVETGIPRIFRGGFKLLTIAEQVKANKVAIKYLNKWLDNHRYNEPLFCCASRNCSDCHNLRERIQRYLDQWYQKGYHDGIPDEVEPGVEKNNLAPSWKSICVAILSNDHSLYSLGFSEKKSLWYSAIKQNEIKQRQCRRN